MFTGIIEENGVITDITNKESITVLTVGSENAFADVKNGDSIAVNGTCLTVIGHTKDEATFEIGPETINKTSLGGLLPEENVNLELPLRMSDRLGGHFVQGHIDTTGKIVSLEDKGDTAWLVIEINPDYQKYITPKGSIAIDGISLTIATIDGNNIGIMLMEYTLKKTNLSNKKAGDIVNIEFDMLAKMAYQMLSKKSENV